MSLTRLRKALRGAAATACPAPTGRGGRHCGRPRRTGTHYDGRTCGRPECQVWIDAHHYA